MKLVFVRLKYALTWRAKAALRPLIHWLGWYYPSAYLYLIIRFKLQRSPYFKLTQDCRAENEQQSTSLEPSKPPSKLQRKRILYAIHWYELSGAELFALYSMRQARDLGYTCFCISTVPSENREKVEFAKHCQSTLDHTAYRDSQHFVEFVSTFIATNRIDIVHIHHSVLMYRALPELRRRFPNLRVVDTTHIVEYGDGGFPQLSARYSPYIDVHNVVSRNLIKMQKLLHREIYRSDLPDEKFALGYLCSLIQAQALPYSHKPDGKKVVLFYGRITFQKQPNLFVAVVEKLARDHPELALEAHIYGEGDMEVALNRRISQSPISERFKLFGRCDEKVKVFNDADVLFLSSLNEGLALTAYEAVTLHRMVVSTDVGAQSELLCSACLVPLSSDFIDVSAAKLYSFLTDAAASAEAMQKNLLNLAALRARPADVSLICQLYETLTAE